MTSHKYRDCEDLDNNYRTLIPYCEEFLNALSKTSRQKYFNLLIDLAIYLEKHFNRKLLEGKATDIKQFLKEKIDCRKIKKATKKMYRNYISGYYNEVKRLKKDLENDTTFINPVPSTKTISFTGIDQPLDIIQIREQLTIKDVKRILEHIFYTNENEQSFYASTLLVLTGARVSEICHVKLNKINLKDRWILTRVKSRRENKRDGIYFFPKFFQNPLKKYIIKIKLEHNTPQYLFQSKNGHISIRSIQKCFRSARESLGIKAKATPHAFRDFINTKRYEAGLRKEDLKFLLNHTLSETYASNYLKNRKNRIILRGLYDDSCPYSKNLLPEIIYDRNPIF